MVDLRIGCLTEFNLIRRAGVTIVARILIFEVWTTDLPGSDQTPQHYAMEECDPDLFFLVQYLKS
ncbi:MAG: hypothetical protein GXO91_03375 [FCB group bacterium]|nr:hypothetical protein [FCB group bacterium]